MSARRCGPIPKLLCRCLKVTEDAVLRAIDSGQVDALQGLIHATGAGEGCTACHPALRRLLRRRTAGAKARAGAVPRSKRPHSFLV